MIEGNCLCGAVRWRFDGLPDGATACNCTADRRYGALWAYDFEGEGIRVSGPTSSYGRGDHLAYHFCPTCGCIAYWRAIVLDDQGRRRIAVNLRLAEPGGGRRDPDRPFRRARLLRGPSPRWAPCRGYVVLTTSTLHPPEAPPISALKKQRRIGDDPPPEP